MIEYSFVSFGEDIINESLTKIKDKMVLIYPTERSCKEAQKRFQTRWQPIDVQFVSMEQFKHSILYSDRIRLEEEKRLVCLYQSLLEEDKKYFHITDYNSFVDWGQNFFKLFEELAEECIDIEELSLMVDGFELGCQEWQKQNYQRLHQIRLQYEEKLDELGYTDAIFENNLSLLHLPSQRYSYLIVNQYYYSKLEKEILKELDGREHKIYILFQGKEEWFDKEKLHSLDFDLEEVYTQDKLPYELKIYQANTPWQMALSFLDNYSKYIPLTAGKHLVIDSKFYKQPYRIAFSKEIFRFSDTIPLHVSNLFRFFQILAKGLEELIEREKPPKVKLLKLDWLLQATAIKGFVDYFTEAGEELSELVFRDLCNLADNDILYLDTKLEFLQLEEVPNLKEETLQFLKKLIKLILKLDNISSPTEFVDVIDTWDGIVVEKLMSEEEWNCSNLAMIFYETLANFKALEDMKIVESWQRLYPQNRLSAGIINLFLQYLKNRRYKFLIEKNFTADIEITNLMDTRNMAAEELSFLNFIEGELPSARSVVWLFNERQRKQLGLKTWEDIRQWERYYLHRLLAHAKKVSFYTIEMQNEDVEASSFLYELYQFACTKTITYLQSWTKTDLPSDTLMKNWIYSYEEYPLLSESHSTKDINQETFFHLPYEDDFGSEKTIFLSWYACNRLLSDSIEYYILDYCKIKPRVVRMEETINNNLFGNIVHEFFSTIFNRLAEQRRGTLSMKWEWINNVFLENNLKSTLNKRIFEYQLPKNHNQIYFEKLLFPFLIKTASYFFHFCLEKETFLKKDFITIIPEEQYHKNRKLIYKKLISAEETKSKLSLYILGRADLRLETEKRKYIFDFKTGTGDAKQLWFYAFYYYLIDNPEMIDILNCAFYHILDFELDWKIREFQRKETLKQKLVDLLSELPQKGFEVGNKTTISYFDPILRIDLKHEIMEDSDLNGDKDE